MMSDTPDRRQAPAVSVTDWKQVIAKYQKPATSKGVVQILNTLIPYCLLWVAMHFASKVSVWLAVPLAIIAGAFLVRTFIIFHDCGHGSFFPSERANHIIGTITGILCFTPYWHWRWEHSIHHSSAGDLDRRGTGDVWTMTVQEYLEASRWKRFEYRLTRNPLILFVIAPVFLFLIRERFTSKSAGPRERGSVYLTNICLLITVLGLGFLMGWKTYIVLQAVVLVVAGSAGVWLFYVQHQFEGVYWERSENWDYTSAALQGSSFYKLPKILQWFSGNIGFHHIHHLSPRIPNYNLEKCHKAEPLFHSVKPVTLLGSLKAINFRFWDEQRRALVGYRELRRIRKQGSQGLTNGA